MRGLTGILLMESTLGRTFPLNYHIDNALPKVCLHHHASHVFAPLVFLNATPFTHQKLVRAES